jgi:hypothetical protein
MEKFSSVLRLGGTVSEFLDYSCRVASYDTEAGNILDDNRARSDDRASTNCHAGSDEGIGGNPNIGFDQDGRLGQWSIRTRVVVTSCAKMGALRDSHSRPKFDRPQGIKDCVIADCCLVRNIEVPRNDNPHCRVDMHLTADFGTKRAQKSRPPAPEGSGGQTEQW